MKHLLKLSITIYFFIFTVNPIAANTIKKLEQRLVNLQSKLTTLESSLEKLGTLSDTPKFVYSTLSEWYDVCKDLPYFQQFGLNYQNKPKKLTEAEINTTIEAFKKAMKQKLQVKDEWVDKNPPNNEYFDTPTFKPFTQKLTLPPGSEVAFHGDLHGDIHAVVEYLNDLKNKGYLDDNFKIIKPNFYIVFLGDYVDRGNFGIEVIYTLLRLKITNPNHVFMVRGNHEDFNLNNRFGFYNEIEEKFHKIDNSFLKHISQIYDLMPVVLYVGSNTHFLQCNHGGMELGYLPKELLKIPSKIGFEWLGTLNYESNFNNIKNKNGKKAEDYSFTDYDPIKTSQVNFLWGDFATDPNADTRPNFLRRVGWIFGKALTQETLNLSSTDDKKVIGVFRAHQHGDPAMMNLILKGKTPGVGKLWDQNSDEIWEGIVATFNVTPDTEYGMRNRYTFDTYGLLTIGKKFPQDWQFKVVNIKNVVP